MPLELDFNAEAARKAPQYFSDKTPQQINDWFQAVAKDAAANPKIVDAVEDAFVKQLKPLAAYADLFAAAVVKLEKGKDTVDAVKKSLATFLPGVTNIEGMVKQRAAIYSNLAKLKGDQTNPALKYFAEQAAKLTDADYAALAKPLRVLADALPKINAPLPAGPKRKFVGS